MPTTQLRVAYRPLRSCFLVRGRSGRDLSEAIRLASVVWGGQCDPILGSDSDLDVVSRAITRFRADALIPISDTPQSQTIVEAHSHLRWPTFGDEILHEGTSRLRLMDLAAALRLGREDGVFDRYTAVIPEVDTDGRHRLLYAATFGDLSKADGYDPPLRTAFMQVAEAVERPAAEVARNLDEFLTPLRATAIGLSWIPPDWYHDERGGIFVGSATSLSHLRAYWNIRSVGIDALFWDVASADGGPFAEAIRQRIEDLASRLNGDSDGFGGFTAYVAGRRESAVIPEPLMALLPDGFRPWRTVIRYDGGISDYWSTGLRYLPSLSEQTLLAHTEDANEEESRVVIPLYSTPLKRVEGRRARQDLVVQIGTWSESGYRGTLKLPFLPDLNDWIRAEMGDLIHQMRIQEDAVGVIDDLEGPTLSLATMGHHKLLVKLFERAGIRIERSLPGEAARHVLRQLGAWSGCAVLRLPSVRTLLSLSRARRGLTRKHAVDVINASGAFADHDPSWIARRELRPRDVWQFLISRGVFLPGFELTCPRCRHPSFFAPEQVSDEVRCPRCANRFALGPALERDPIRFRLSSLFVDDMRDQGVTDADHQPAAIPVLLALLYLGDWAASFEGLILETSHLVTGNQVDECESDVIAVAYGARDEPHTHVLLGECKGSGRVDNEDLEKLSKARQALRESGIRCDLFFATTRDSFDTSEMELFSRAFEESSELPALRRCPILLTATELDRSRFSVPGTDHPDRFTPGFDPLVFWTRRHYFEEEG